MVGGSPIEMRRLVVLIASTLALSLLSGAGVMAEKPLDNTPQTRQDDTPQRIGTLEVRLPISVKEKNKFVTGLTVNNFEVYEDGKRQKIINFMSPSQLPLNIGMLMDTSNSVKL